MDQIIDQKNYKNIINPLSWKFNIFWQPGGTGTIKFKTNWQFDFFNDP